MLPMIGDLIRRKLDDALLPCHDPVKTWTGYGRGGQCDACETPILPAQHEYELKYDDGKSYRLHLGCWGIWEGERRRRGKLRARRPSSDKRSTPATDQPILRGIHVLLVADTYDGREVVQAVLEYYGASVTMAASAGEAMERFRAIRPDVLVGALPTWLIREARSAVRAMAVKVPLIAIVAEQHRRDKLLADGVDACSMKPLDLIALCQEIRRQVRR